ncbi:site-specific integrase [Anaerosinus massiliensis]|uniref:site-specific integrase n=1 Tax=Massilibacillus massiliensis TaxID=1806837 RepID=UPI000A7FD839|nr:site-specific integrase [Massilibacillus massiliensis]
MEYVQPIRDKKQLENMKRYLKEQNLRDWLLFVLGINSGLRISDLLQLTIDDVRGKDRITIREQKTNKTKDFPLSDTCKKAIGEYFKTTGLTEGVLFSSRKSSGSKGTGAISRQQAYDIISSAAKEVGIKDAIGTHTLRKTFGYHAYKAGVGIEVIQKLLNHSAPSVTLRYIGITQEQLDNVYINLNL